MSWMRAHAPALRMIWAVFGVMAAVVLVLGTASDALIFILAFGSHTGSYAGQSGDQSLAWRVLFWLAGGWVVVLLAMIWPAIRWKRRGLYTMDEAELAEADAAGEPAR